MPRSERSNAPLFWGVLVAIVAIDIVTKLMAERHLPPVYGHVNVFGDWFRLTLVYNPGAAFGLYLGRFSRWIFMGLTIGALGILGRLLLATRPGDTPRVLAIALVCAGAIGNLVDRVRSERGVVDFLDVGFGSHRWPTFNVADMAVSSGAFLLAWVLWQEERAIEAAERAAAAARDHATPPPTGVPPTGVPPTGLPQDVT